MESMKTKKESYLIEIRFCSKSYYAVWETDSNGNDSLLKKEDKILISPAKHFSGVIFKSEAPAVYDFEFIKEMLRNHFKDIDYEQTLSFWNLTQDAAYTIDYKFLGNNNKKYFELYNKIFQSTSAGNIVREHFAKNNPKDEIEVQMEAKLYKSDAELQLAKKDRESLCLIAVKALEMWSEIIGGITKEASKKQLQRKFEYNSKKFYIPLNDIKINIEYFYIMRGTIEPYEQKIRNYLLKRYEIVFYLSNYEQAYYLRDKDFFEMSDKIEFDDMRSEEVVFPKDFSFLIYISHEQTITFAGKIVEDIKKILAPVAHKFNKYVLV